MCKTTVDLVIHLLAKIFTLTEDVSEICHFENCPLVSTSGCYYTLSITVNILGIVTWY